LHRPGTDELCHHLRHGHLCACSAPPLSPLATSLSSRGCGESFGADLVVCDLPCSGPADRWGQLTHGPRLSVSLCDSRVIPWGAFSVFSGDF
jgi:hypothetical protein